MKKKAVKPIKGADYRGAAYVSDAPKGVKGNSVRGKKVIGGDLRAKHGKG